MAGGEKGDGQRTMISTFICIFPLDLKLTLSSSMRVKETYHVAIRMPPSSRPCNAQASYSLVPSTSICGFDEFFPLLKTNRTSLHPILATIYFDLFYHHGCGSRVFASRATNIGYYDQILARSGNSSDEIFEFLRADPRGFIESLY